MWMSEKNTSILNFLDLNALLLIYIWNELSMFNVSRVRIDDYW